MSYEWIMYQNIKSMCEVTGLPVEREIPASLVKEALQEHLAQVAVAVNTHITSVQPQVSI